MFSRARSWLVPLAALLFFAVLAVEPWVRPGHGSPPWVEAARRSAPVPLTPALPALPQLRLAEAARPSQAQAAPASPSVADSSRMAALVAAEDVRLRTLLHHSNRLTTPAVVPVRGAVPTLVLPGPRSYGLADLQDAGAVLPLQQGGGFLLVDSVLVAPGATLKLGGPDLPMLLMDSSPQGFTSIVTWGGTLTLAGASSQAPLTIRGWDSSKNVAAVDGSNGRPYIRDVGGRLDLVNVRASSLGFWSGRTGGVAWTGVSSRVATGSAIASTFTGDVYGAFVSRADHVQFTDDLFEANELDGLRLHRSAAASTVTGAAAARNGGNGFVVSRGAIGNVLTGDLAVNNRGNGFLLNGQPLVNGASPAGRQTAPSVGTILQGSDAEGNGRTGILVEGGAATVIRNNIVCGAQTGIAVRSGATDTTLVGNQVRCGGRIALSIGPGVEGTTVAGNTLSQARIGALIRNSPGVRLMDNQITGISLFGISVRGGSTGVVGNDNVIAGRGFQAIDTRGGAPSPLLESSDLSGWQHRSGITALSYLRYHPILTIWLAIIALVALAALIVRIRRRRGSIYSHAARPLMTPSATGVAAFHPPAPAAARPPPPEVAAIAPQKVPAEPAATVLSGRTDA